MHFKHLRGQHDQRTHGHPGTGIGAGGYSSQLGQYSSESSPQPRTNFVMEGRISTDLGQIEKDGLPSMKRVERGSEQIFTVEDAVDFVKNGGSLRDVPDDFLLASLDANKDPSSKPRFRQNTPPDAGVNGTPEVYTDSTNGQRYFIKYRYTSYRENEDVAEMLGNNIAGRLGFPIGAVRTASGEKSSPKEMPQTFRKPVFLEHVSNMIPGNMTYPGDSASQLSVDDLVSASILDYLSLNPDRHRGNYFWAAQKNKSRFVPIDPSLGFNVLLTKKDQQKPFTDERDIQNFFNSHNGLHVDLRFKRFLGERGFSTRKSQIRTVAKSIEQLRIRLLESEKRLPFAVAAMDAVRAAGESVGRRSMNRAPEGIDRLFPELEEFGPPRIGRQSIFGGFKPFIDWPAQRIQKVISMNSEEFANILLGDDT